MTLQVPTLLTLLGAALLAIAIFAPRAARSVAVSVPTAHAAAVEHWVPPLEDDVDYRPFPEPRAANTARPTWPERFDPRAAGSDPAARIELIGALADVHAGWAEVILRAALDDESDPHVRRVLEEAAARRYSDAASLGTAASATIAPA